MLLIGVFKMHAFIVEPLLTVLFGTCCLIGHHTNFYMYREDIMMM